MHNANLFDSPNGLLQLLWHVFFAILGIFIAHNNMQIYTPSVSAIEVVLAVGVECRIENRFRFVNSAALVTVPCAPQVKFIAPAPPVPASGPCKIHELCKNTKPAASGHGTLNNPEVARSVVANTCTRVRTRVKLVIPLTWGHVN
jgi:hypothetical protein